MVDFFGRWTEEKDYSTYPKEKWCDYDHMAVWIRSWGYIPQTSMENLISMIFAHYEACSYDDNETFSIEGCIEFVENSGGIREFDYEV